MRSIHNPDTQSEMKAVLMECANCGHCIDLGTPTPNDPIEVTNAREDIFEQIQIWLAADAAKKQLKHTL